MWIFLNGDYVELEKATISPFDRGFLFSDGVYEVIRYYPPRGFFRADDHLRRLAYGLDQLRTATVDFEMIREVTGALVERNGLSGGQAIVYIQVTRGSHFPRQHFFPPPSVKPTLFMTAGSFMPHKSEIEKGTKVILEHDIRWARCDIKTIALLPNIMSRQRAIDQGATEAIWSRDGELTEGTHTNLCIVKNGTLVTPPRSNLILSGITRQVVLEICQSSGIPVEERPVREKELWECDECMLVGTTTEITPIIKVNDRTVGGGKAGEVTRKLQKRFYALIA